MKPSTMELPQPVNESESKKQANLPVYVKNFMNRCSHLLTNQNTESFEGETTILFDTVYGLRVTKTEQDGGIMLNFSLVPSSTSLVPLPPGERRDYIIMPYSDWDYFYCEQNEDDNINRFPTIAMYFEKWQDRAEKDVALLVKKRQITDPHLRDQAELPYFDCPFCLMEWKIEGFLMACWIALQHDVGNVTYYTNPMTFYRLNKENNNFEALFLELNTDINELVERPYSPSIPPE
ncbi:hypothetical protein F5B19DRAFT_470255 [Rostrohypoxylon terebratum]|nr:hypothetical protein F5B19DRAFT_470255 [Rostrohypoxylon terebratum]